MAFTGFPDASAIAAMGGAPAAPGAAGTAAGWPPHPPTQLATSTPAPGTGAGGPILPMTPPTVGALLGTGLGTHGMAEYLENLGAEMDTPSDVFYLVPEELLTSTLAEVQVDGVGLNPIQKAKLSKVIQEAFALGGRIPPRLGSVGFQAGPTGGRAPSAAAPSILAIPASTLEDMPTELVHLNRVVDQSLAGHARRLSYTELRDFRVHYENTTGAPPVEDHLPTADQLAGLRAILASGRPPYVDFAVWSSLGPRVAKFRRTEAAVLVGGVFVTKTSDTPSSFSAWEDSWGLFSVAMVSLNAASPGTLAAYLGGIKQLLKLFPARWSQISGTDLVVRSERWQRIREDLERAPPPGVDLRAPWDYIIGMSAFGRGGPYESWWHTHLVLPMSLGCPLALEGLPSSSSSSSRPPSAAQSGPKRKGGGGGSSGNASSKKESCRNWNLKQGTCAGSGPCPNKRNHICDVCDGNHRSSDHHGQGQATRNRGKGNGKGKSNKGNKDKIHLEPNPNADR